MLKGFRKTDSLYELESSLNSIQDNLFSLTCWQVIGPEKQITDAFLRESLKNKDTFFLTIELRQNCDLNQKEPIFIHCRNNHTLLKGKIKTQKKGIIKIQISNKFYLKEHRSAPRLNFLDQDYKIRIYRKQPMTEYKREDKVKLHDISLQGCGFMIHASRATTYRVDMELEIDKIAGVTLDFELLGRITHITPLEAIGKISQNSMLVGVFFHLSEHNINDVIEKLSV